MTILERIGSSLDDPQQDSFPYEARSEATTALVFDVRREVEDPSRAWVVEGATALADWLRDQLPSGYTGPFSAVVIEDFDVDESARPYVEALAAAVRVIVNSLAIEYPRTLLTTVRVDSAGLSALEATLQYLSMEAGSYVTASTIDLRSMR